MKVKELIALLEEQPKSQEVVFMTNTGNRYWVIDDITLGMLKDAHDREFLYTKEDCKEHGIPDGAVMPVTALVAEE